MEKHPENSDAWTHLHYLLYVGSNDYLGLKQFCEKILAVNPKTTQAWWNLGFAYRGLKDEKCAQQCWDKAIQLKKELNVEKK